MRSNIVAIKVTFLISKNAYLIPYYTFVEDIISWAKVLKFLISITIVVRLFQYRLRAQFKRQFMVTDIYILP